MLKKIQLLFVLSCVTFIVKSQILYSEHFNNLTTIATATQSSGDVYLYADVPTGMLAVNTNSLIADTLTGNYPFRAIGQKQKGWLTYKPYELNDTFAVSTSWFAPVANADVWLITPLITSITASTVVSWEAMAPDAGHLDGYDVYISTNTSTNVFVSDFTTKLMSVSAENSMWTKRGLSIGTYSNTAGIHIAFRNNSSNQFQLWLDDIVIENKADAIDMEAVSYNTYKYSTINTNNVISATFKNKSFTPVTSFEVQYKVGSTVSTSETINLATPLYYNESKLVNFSELYSSSTAKYNDVKIYVNKVNTLLEVNQSNDTVYGSLTLALGLATKKVLLEEYTGSWCGWCPDATTKTQSILTNTNIIAVSHHDADSMQNANSNVLITDYTTSFPSATIDQYQFSASNTITHERTEWNTFSSQRLLVPSPVSVSISTPTYNIISRQIDATVSTNFLAELKGDYRINLYIKENNVYGPIMDSTNNGWNQLSYMQNIPSSPYYGFGIYYDASHYLLRANEYKHQYVVNEMLDGAYGSVIPAPSTSPTSVYTKAYTTTLPLPVNNEFRYNEDNIYLVAVVSEYNADTKKREILNVTETKLNANSELQVGINEFKNKTQNAILYPNPANNAFTVYVANNETTMVVEVVNILGNVVYTGATSSDKLTIDTSNLSSGNYFVTVKTKANSFTKKLIITN